MPRDDRFFDYIDPTADMIRLYYTRNPTGGWLHVVLDDHNLDAGLIRWCAGEARKHRDWMGIAIARMLLDLTEEERIEAIELGSDTKVSA